MLQLNAPIFYYYDNWILGDNIGWQGNRSHDTNEKDPEVQFMEAFYIFTNWTMCVLDVDETCMMEKNRGYN